MRALVLGGTGSIGSVVSRHLLQQGFDVYALSRSSTSATQMLDMGAIPVRGDIRHPHEWIDCLQDIDAVIHAASCLLYTSPSPRDQRGSRMPSSA